ncbi:hypothetical protein VH571_06215 [Frondihabitans sp. 4ASC-45]|uniref:hypothetical protein n=1 Tax=Frondihabitans sp. 4ASC-45 TaxID=3111636 RepID=UPI003C222DEA
MSTPMTPPGPHSAPHASPGRRASSRRRRRGSRLPEGLAGVGVTAGSVLVAAVAVGVLIVVRFVVALIQLLGNAVAYDPSAYGTGFLAAPVGLFLRGVVLDPLPFYVVALLALAVVFRVTATVSLLLALARAVAAGAAGAAALVVGGLIASVPSGDVAAIVVGTVFAPLALGVQLTAVLAGGVTLSWLWATRLEAAGAATAVAASTVDGDGDGNEDPSVEPPEARPVGGEEASVSAHAVPDPAIHPAEAPAPAPAPPSDPESLARFAPPAPR